MSFNNGYGDQFQGPPQGDMNNPTPQPGDMGQPMDTSGNGFPPQGNMGPPGSAGGDGQGQGAGKTTLWMGELEPWIDENFVRSIWYNMGETVNVKMIRDKFSGSNAGYCFVDFASPDAAAKALNLNGQLIPNSNRPFKLNWASGGGLADRRQVLSSTSPNAMIANTQQSRDERGPEFSIFVGDLGPEVTEFVLVQLFQNKYPSTKSAKIMSDPISGMSRGYGFVRFASEEDQQKALTEMQGVYCGNRPMRISTATPKNKSGGPGGPGGMGMPQGAGGPGMGMYSMGAPPMGNYYGAPQPMNQFTDPNNTTVFVGGLSGYVTEDELRSFFQGFGEITYVKIPPGKGCGFVQFVQRHAAEMAINQMQGYPIGNSRVRLSWGRSQNNSGPAGTPYRPAPPPPVPFGPGMGMPQHPYGGGGGYGPMMKPCLLSSFYPYQLQPNCQLLIVLLDLNSTNHTPTMRYDDWDVILFPRDSHVPIQEFKTACFVSQADYGRPLPTLTCFINSLPPSTPFRISLHSWRTVLKASALLESQRKGNQKIVFMVQVVIGEIKVFHGFFDLASKWPQEITHEKRSLACNDLPSSQRRRPLEFPPFHSITLINNTWDARDPYGRIQVVLSEQLINKTPGPGNLGLGPANELCPQVALAASWTPHALPFADKAHIQTPPSQNSQSMFGKPHEAKFKQHPNARLSHIPPFTKQPVGSTSRNCHASAWDDAFISLDHGADDFSKDNWSTETRTSASYDCSTPGYISTSHSSGNVPSWMGNMSQCGRSKSNEWNDQSRSEGNQVVVTLRDDQLGQIIDALSPPKHNHETSRTPSTVHHERGQKASHNYFPSKQTADPPMNSPFAAFLARKSSHSDSNSVLRNISNKLSSQKHHSQDGNKDTTPTIRRSYISAQNEDIDPSQLRLQTPSPHYNIIPKPHPFIQRQPTAVSDFFMRDWPSPHSSIRRLNQNEALQSVTEFSTLGSSHGPFSASARIREENQASNSPKVLDQATRHTQNTTQAASPDPRAGQTSTSKSHKPFTPHNRNTIPDLVEIIDIDAISPDLTTNANANTAIAGVGAAAPSPFKPTHKPATSLSSTDSTVRLERQLFSALGEELGSFDHHIDTAGLMGPELAQALGGVNTHSEISGSVALDSTASDAEPAGKRKRGSTLGAGSPLSKREKAELVGEQEERGFVRGE
ncbi:mrna binding post-transcriptional regulator [Curvularia clavata]|uniref:Mrna binding post-transcriptional regulator n=1 Tax=Curvularia clavata TaxID=95742 RepID=A0A9Q9DSZ3_CURCL|nr:mrna binding post-transcriptional regulator [Curvularia clavata]